MIFVAFSYLKALMILHRYSNDIYHTAITYFWDGRKCWLIQVMYLIPEERVQITALISCLYEYRYIFCWAMFYHFGTFYSNKSMLSQWRQRHCFVWIKLTLKISCYFFCYYFLMYVQSVKFFYYAWNNKYKKIFEHVGLRKQQNPT